MEVSSAAAAATGAAAASGPVAADPGASPGAAERASGSPRIAIVGSGPSGCYTAQALRRELGPRAVLEVFEELPDPYGLARYGVAADHAGTRAVARQFDRLFERDGVVLHCGVEVGGPSGVPLAELRAGFDAVVLAIGLPDDLPLDLDGAGLDGVIGAGLLLRTLNGHPELRVDPRPLGPVSVVVGAGNVAMDAIRLLAKPASELADSGIDEAARAAFTEGLRTVHVLSRSLPDDARADLAMLREIAAIDGIAHRLHLGAEADGPEGERSALLRAMCETPHDRAKHRLSIEWWFGYRPARIVGDSSVRALEIVPRAASDQAVGIPLEADTVVTAIGFARTPGELGPFPGDEPAETGRVVPGLYVAGWLRRGPRGTIATQRSDSRELARVIAADLRAGRHPGAPGAETTGPGTTSGAVALTWPVHPPFLDYLRRLDDFTVTTCGAAGYSEASGVRIIGSEREGVFSAAGGVRLRAHDGALTLNLDTVRIEDGALWIADPLGKEGERLRLVELQETARRDSARRFSTRLAPEAEPLFNFVYPPGTEFAPLTLSPAEAEA